MSWTIRDPRSLSKERLANIIEALQEFLYLEKEGGDFFVNPEKETNGGDLVEFVDGVLSENGLYPKMMSRKDWSPRGFNPPI